MKSQNEDNKNIDTKNNDSQNDQCEATTKKGKQCTFKKKFGEDICARHYNLSNKKKSEMDSKDKTERRASLVPSSAGFNSIESQPTKKSLKTKVQKKPMRSRLRECNCFKNWCKKLHQNSHHHFFRNLLLISLR